jgi:hypothetical protein
VSGLWCAVCGHFSRRSVDPRNVECYPATVPSPIEAPIYPITTYYFYEAASRAL